jgi:hypothetical protein
VSLNEILKRRTAGRLPRTAARSTSPIDIITDVVAGDPLYL